MVTKQLSVIGDIYMKKIVGMILICVVLATAFAGCMETKEEEKCTVTVKVYNHALYTLDIYVGVYDKDYVDDMHPYTRYQFTTLTVSSGGVGTVTWELPKGESRKIVAKSENGDTDSMTIDCSTDLYTVKLDIYY